MRSKKSKLFKTVTVFLLLLSGCGGGGGDDDSSNVVRSVSIQATGFSASGSHLSSAGEADGNWAIIRAGIAPSPAVLLTPDGPNWYIRWLLNSATSQWLGASNAASPGAAPYSFQLTFSLGDFDPAQTELVGRWAIDDDGEIAVNGTVVDRLDQSSLDDSPNWNQLNTFSVTPGSGLLHAGQNTITMTITQTDNFLEGARFEGELRAIRN